MTGNKQISIEELSKFMKPGYVAYDQGGWFFFVAEPYQSEKYKLWMVSDGNFGRLSEIFNIKPFDGDWKDSLMEIKG